MASRTMLLRTGLIAIALCAGCALEAGGGEDGAWSGAQHSVSNGGSVSTPGASLLNCGAGSDGGAPNPNGSPDPAPWYGPSGPNESPDPAPWHTYPVDPSANGGSGNGGGTKGGGNHAIAPHSERRSVESGP